MYHNIAERAGFNTVSLEAFRAQMNALSKSDNKVLPLSEYVLKVNADALEKDEYVITFDDAYVSFRELAMPVLEEFNFPVSLFVPVNFVGKENVWDVKLGSEKIEIMDWDAINFLAKKPLVEIGSHGLNHQSMGGMNPEEFRKEIADSKRILESKLESAVQSFSFPFGQRKDIPKNAAWSFIKSGYTTALSTIWGDNQGDVDAFELQRIEICPTDTLPQFMRKVNGKDHVRFFKQLAKNKIQQLKQVLSEKS